MKSLTNYISEKLVINKNFKRNDAISTIIDMFGNGKTYEISGYTMGWGYLLETSDNDEWFTDIKYVIRKNYEKIKADKLLEALNNDEIVAVFTDAPGHGFDIYFLINDKPFVINIFEDSKKYIEIIAYLSNISLKEELPNEKARTEITSCYVLPNDDMKELFNYIVDNNKCYRHKPSETEYEQIINALQ